MVLSDAKDRSFKIYHRRYDDWFVREAADYQTELLAVCALSPRCGLGLVIGVGTGRFASHMGVQLGIDPAHEVLNYAANRGIFIILIYNSSMYPGTADSCTSDITKYIFLSRSMRSYVTN